MWYPMLREIRCRELIMMRIALIIAFLFTVSSASFAELTEKDIQQIKQIIHTETKPGVVDTIKTWIPIVFAGVLAWATIALYIATRRYAKATVDLVEATNRYTKATERMAEIQEKASAIQEETLKVSKANMIIQVCKDTPRPVELRSDHAEKEAHKIFWNIYQDIFKIIEAEQQD